MSEVWRLPPERGRFSPSLVHGFLSLKPGIKPAARSCCCHFVTQGESHENCSTGGTIGFLICGKKQSLLFLLISVTFRVSMSTLVCRCRPRGNPPWGLCNAESHMQNLSSALRVFHLLGLVASLPALTVQMLCPGCRNTVSLGPPLQGFGEEIGSFSARPFSPPSSVSFRALTGASFHVSLSPVTLSLLKKIDPFRYVFI